MTGDHISPPPASTPEFRWCTDEYLLLEWDAPIDLSLVMTTLQSEQVIRESLGEAIMDSLAGWSTVLLRLTRATEGTERVEYRIRDALQSAEGVESEFASRKVTVPVKYGGDCGPDLEFVAGCNGIDIPEAIERLSRSTHFSGMVSFTPGMANCLWVEAELALSAPKYESPRTTTPEGTVGLGGSSIAMYSLPSPGGFQMIGTAAVPLYRAGGIEVNGVVSPALFQPGDRITLRSVTIDEYLELRERAARDEYDYEVEPGVARISGGTVTWT